MPLEKNDDLAKIIFRTIFGNYTKVIFEKIFLVNYEIKKNIFGLVRDIKK